jgi:hypothetical protein
MEIMATDSDPCNPNHDPDNNPLQCYQTLKMCQKDANSSGLFARHYTTRHFVNVPKTRLWEIIPDANVARQMQQYNKHK